MWWTGKLAFQVQERQRETEREKDKRKEGREGEMEGGKERGRKYCVNEPVIFPLLTDL